MALSRQNYLNSIFFLQQSNWNNLEDIMMIYLDICKDFCAVIYDNPKKIKGI